jgi:threonine synthase
MNTAASAAARPRGIIEQYREFLPVDDATPVVTLGEGATPLIEAPRLAAWICAGGGGAARLRVFLKFEGMNPTGSFKDRGMTLAISKALEHGARTVICASTGNTSASAAAYAARAGLRCVVLLPRGEVALGKLSQALIHGAQVLAIDGNFDEALCLVRDLAAACGVELVNSVNPARIEGQKTGAFEIVDALGDAPDFHAIPVGNAGNITAYWKGYGEYERAGRATRRPRMLGFQAAGAAPLVDGAPVAAPETVATAIRIGNPASWAGAVAARDESGGRIEKVTDAQILEAYAALAATEGVFAEPACAAPVAGLRMLASAGYFDDQPAATVAITLTGHGLKDPDRAVRTAESGITEVAASPDAIRRAVEEAGGAVPRPVLRV